MQTTFTHNLLSRGDGRRWISLGLAASAVTVFVLGLVLSSPGLLGGGAVALCALWQAAGGVALLKARPASPSRNGHASPGKQRFTNPAPSEPTPPQPPIERPAAHRANARRSQSKDTVELVRTMIEESRYALLLRPETASQLSEGEIADVLEVMDEYMSVVPAGRVLVGEYAERATWGSTPTAADCAGLIYVAGCYLDRFATTNVEFQHFVDAGGYEQFQLWPEEALPALFEFVDRTGIPAPASWIDGHFPDGQDRLPVVGVSYFEAAAYAQWVGKRLPTDAEWTKAGAWPVETSPGRVSQRRYPWGDTFEARRAALWSAGRTGPRPVDEYELGASLGSVYQLIGNVWEWTSSSLDSTSRDSADGHGLKVIHGGAYNTYFENQATCHFRSGERPLARRANVGFRLALSFDAVADQDNGQESQESQAQSPEQE